MALDEERVKLREMVKVLMTDNIELRRKMIQLKAKLNRNVDEDTYEMSEIE
jgi:hypothetical protein